MARELEPYEQQLAKAKEMLKRDLSGARARPIDVAVLRGAILIMDDELKTKPRAVLKYYSSKLRGLSGPELWLQMSKESAAKPFRKAELQPAQWIAKTAEYATLRDQLRKRQALDYAFRDRLNGFAYVTHDNPKVGPALTEIIDALGPWVALHSSDPNFLQTSATASLMSLMEERQDLAEALRIAQELPKDGSAWRVPVDRPTMLEVVEIGISLIPYVGTAVALLEAAAGKDLFGYALDPIDRSILAAGALLPFAARFVKGGRALYTAGRLQKLYGRDVAKFDRVLGIGERLSADPQFVRKLRQARQVTMAGGKADAGMVTKIADALKKADLKNARPQLTSLPQEVADVIKKLGAGKPILAELDAPAIHRVLKKQSKVKMRGQLLEELLEARVATWLRDPAGAAALGIDAKDVMFFPGHMIRHPTGGREITDGILVRRVANTWQVVAIFEAKSSVRKVKELRAAKTGASTLTAADRAELRQVALEEVEEMQELAKSEGRVYTRTVAEHEAELLKPLTQNEEGQIRRSIERLYEKDAAGTLSTVRVNGVETQIQVSLTRTKVFGVVPRGTDLPKLESECRALGYNFEALGMDISSKELDELVEALAKSAGVLP